MTPGTSLATAPGGSHPNEDWAGAAGNTAVVLDGLSAPQGVGGCDHGTPWFVANLGARLLMHTTDPRTALEEALSRSIADVARLHPECDLADPGAPSSTVSLARANQLTGQLDWLVLADSPVLIQAKNGRVDVVNDTRVDRMLTSEREKVLAAPHGEEKLQLRRELVDAQRRIRNTPGGYWIARSEPEAASHAFTGSTPLEGVERVALMSDGVSRLVEVYEAASWGQVMEALSVRGAAALIDWVREVESSDPDGTRWPRNKISDDAAAVFWGCPGARR